MFLKNTCARLIVINTPKPFKKSYQLIPTFDPVEIPDEEINKLVQAYIDGLIKAGEVVEVAAPKAVKEEAEPAKRGRKPKDDAETVTE